MPQGSILSPALFNIFIEDLAIEISEKLGLDLGDILKYADDILILCDTIGRTAECIKIIEEWSVRNGMTLNKNKSGIVVFAERSAHSVPLYRKATEKEKEEGEENNWIPARKEIQGVPLVSKYKYLGTYLDSKLTLKTQINSISKKSNFLFIKLYPYLAHATAEGRRDMWVTMVRPLFESIWAVFYEEWAAVNIEEVNRVWIGTFKRFMMIPKTTETYLVNEMIGIDLLKTASRSTWNSLFKWEARIKKTTENIELEEKPKIINYLRGIPNEWCQILKQQCRLCHICKKSNMNAKHMEEQHKIDIICHQFTWEAIKQEYDRRQRKQEKKGGLEALKKIPRKDLYEEWKERLVKIHAYNNKELKSVYINKKPIGNTA